MVIIVNDNVSDYCTLGIWSTYWGLTIVLVLMLVLVSVSVLVIVLVLVLPWW